MRLVVQRVLKAQVFVDLKQIGSIGQGAVVLLGIDNRPLSKPINIAPDYKSPQLD